MTKLPLKQWERFAKQIDEPFTRRPVLGAAVSLIIGIFAGNRQWWWILIFGVLLLLGRAAVIFYLGRRSTQKTRFSPLLICSVILLILGYILVAKVPTKHPYLLQLNTSKETVFCDLTGQIRRVHETEYGVQYELKDVTVKNYGNLGRLRVLVRTKEKTAQFVAGDVIHVMGDASAFSAPRNPGEFDQKTYYAALKVGFSLKANRTECIEPCRNPIQLCANFLAKNISENFHKLANNKYASVFDAMVLGNRDELDEKIYELFSVCGIGHILAISGLHISMLGMGLYKLLRRLGVRAVLGMILGGAGILFYGLITGNGVSTTRALIMYLVAVYAHTQKRSYDVLTAASLAAILMLLDSPLYLYHCGFLLSYGAILGISVLAPSIEKWIPEQLSRKESVRNRLIAGLLRSLSGSLAISLVTLPITLYFYFQVPVLSALLNLIVIPLMTIVMASALAGGLAGFINGALASFCIGPAVMILKFYEWLCAGMLRIPWSIAHPGRPKVWQMVLYYVMLGVLIICTQKINWKKQRGKILGAFAGIFAVVVICIRPHAGLEVTFLDVGQGDGFFVRTENNTTILVDGGSLTKPQLDENTLKQFLLSEGVTKVDYWIMTHADADHVSGTTKLLSKGEIQFQHVILPDTELLDDAYKKIILLAKKNGAKIITVSKGDQLSAGNCRLDFLHPEAGYETEERNNYSTSFLLSYGNFQMLCCGDVAAEQENEILEELRTNELLDESLEVLKANHHGSRYSNSVQWLNELRPEYFIISCGEGNSYGHPHKEVLERVLETNAQVFRTDESGAIQILKGYENTDLMIKCYYTFETW